MNRQDLAGHAIEIAGEYSGNLTVRQLYYQLVARGYIASGQNEYKRVVTVVADARMAGDMPFDWIVDRTRECQQSDFADISINVDQALDQARRWIRDMPYHALSISKWFGQSEYVLVGVEKEALAGVFQDTCERLGVGLFVFRGYSSLSSLYQLCQHLDLATQRGVESARILYFGDFDPDGWEIPRSAIRNVEKIARVAELDYPPITLQRVALNMDQIERYSPPPFHAKVTSSRYEGYIREHGTNKAWELDALRPDVLQDLIRTSVLEFFDQETHEENRSSLQDARSQMKTLMRQKGWIASVFEGER